MGQGTIPAVESRPQRLPSWNLQLLCSHALPNAAVVRGQYFLRYTWQAQAAFLPVPLAPSPQADSR